MTSNNNKKDEITFFQSRVQAGFPSPADDYIDGSLNLHQLLISNPTATFFVRVQGDSMIEAGIFNGDLLIVDKSITPRSGHIVIASLNGEYTVKKLEERNGQYCLVAGNKNYSKIVINEQSEFSIWGVVIHSIHTL